MPPSIACAATVRYLTLVPLWGYGELMFIATVADVAKKKPIPVPPPDDPKRKPMVVQVRGSEEYKAWAEKMARFDGMSLASLVDRALRKYAKEIGFPDTPPSR